MNEIHNMNISEILTKYDKAKADVKKYDELIKEHQQEFVDKYVIGKCFIDKRWHNYFGDDIKRFYYKVNKINFWERSMFNFDICADHIYRCTCIEEEVTERISHYHYSISDQNYPERVSIYSKNIYEFFTDNELIEEVSEEEFFKRLKKETGIENIEQLPNLINYRYKNI